MLVCRPRGGNRASWRISAAFNVSQQDIAPLTLYRETLDCGSMRKAGNGGWYWEVNRLPELQSRIIPFFERFPLLGTKAGDFDLFRQAVGLLSEGTLDGSKRATLLALRERMNRGGKRRYTMERILRDYTPNPTGEHQVG